MQALGTVLLLFLLDQTSVITGQSWPCFGTLHCISVMMQC